MVDAPAEASISPFICASRAPDRRALRYNRRQGRALLGCMRRRQPLWAARVTAWHMVMSEARAVGGIAVSDTARTGPSRAHVKARVDRTVTISGSLLASEEGGLSVGYSSTVR
jgi:hypothetical protein